MPRLFADILLPIARGTFTFAVGDNIADEIKEGFGVEVTLGPRKRYMGLVWRLHSTPPDFPKIKPIEGIVMPEALVSRRQMEFWEWIADYYMCTLGEVMRAALPSSLKPSGLSAEEFSEDKYKPRTIRHIALSKELRSERSMTECLESLGRAKAQQAALTEICGRLLEKAGVEIPAEKNSEEEAYAVSIPRKELKASDAVIKKLVEREIIHETWKEVDDGGDTAGEGFGLPVLTDSQNTALDAILESFRNSRPAVLHGITGSGKTELYMHLISRTISEGRSVLYLMPEIVMTSQIIERMTGVFGDRVTVYHSMLTDRRRAETYRKMLAADRSHIIMGVRSSVFLPFPNIGLIIVDEEHDQSYKQTDSAPRYSARDCAVMLALIHGAGIVMGSATPSLESYTNTVSGKYTLATLNERYGGGKLPRIIVSDTLRAVKRGERKAHFNKEFTDRLTAALNAGRQAIVFQNRRGYSPYVECAECGGVVHCQRCTVALTYHKHDNRLKCHWCGYGIPMPAVCPSCGKPHLQTRGFGTEKVDEELQRLYPDARIIRLDRDTATSPKRYGEIVKAFESGQYDILVGTQIITKGFDFANVSLVGILNADNMLNYPDFRASERAYQIMTQVAGRAGRADGAGEVVIQTAQPDNRIIGFVAANNYEGVVRSQLAERAVFNYPPYSRLINIRLSQANAELLSKGAESLAAGLRKMLGNRVFGPHPPAVDRVGNVNMLDIMLKCEVGNSFAEIKKNLKAQLSLFGKDKRFRALSITVNVDPQ